MTIRWMLTALAAGLMSAAMARAGDGAALYEKKCAVCHSLAGKAGKFAEVYGDSPLFRTLTPRKRGQFPLSPTA